MRSFKIWSHSVATFYGNRNRNLVFIGIRAYFNVQLITICAVVKSKCAVEKGNLCSCKMCSCYNTIQFRLMAQKTPPADTDATEDYTRKNVAYWKRQEDEYFLSYFMIAEKHKFH